MKRVRTGETTLWSGNLEPGARLEHRTRCPYGGRAGRKGHLGSKDTSGGHREDRQTG